MFESPLRERAYDTALLNLELLYMYLICVFFILAEPKGEATNCDALSLCVCMYVNMYICICTLLHAQCPRVINVRK